MTVSQYILILLELYKYTKTNNLNFLDAILVSDAAEKKIVSLDTRKMRSKTLISSELGEVADMEYGKLLLLLYYSSFKVN